MLATEIKTKTVVLAQSTPIVVETLRLALDQEPGVTVVGAFHDARALLAWMATHEADVVLIDPFLEGIEPLEYIEKLKLFAVDSAVLTVLLKGGWQLAYRLMQIGVKGCLASDCRLEEMVKAIDHVASGRIYMSPPIQEAIVEDYVGDNSNEQDLSQREFQVMRLLVEGFNHSAIAEKLRIRVKTVDTHRANLLRKLGIANNVLLTRFAIRRGLLEA